MSFLLPAAISVGSSLLSGALTDQPEVPDLVGETRGQISEARRNMREGLEQRSDRLDAALAARGVTGSGGVSARQGLFRANNSAMADLESRAADILSEAINREKLMQFQQDRQTGANRARAIAGMGQGLSDAIMQKRFLDQILGSSAGGGINEMDVGGSGIDLNSLLGSAF